MAGPATSSIEFLMPNCTYLFQSSNCHGFGTAQPTEEKQGKEESPAVEELKKLTKAVILSINNRSFAATKKLAAQSYKGDIDELPKTDSYGETEEDFRAVAAQNPEYHIDIVDVCPDVDEESGYAIVYCLLSVKGRPANVRRQSVSVVEWMYRDGRWQYFNASVMRGSDCSEVPGAPACTPAAAAGREWSWHF